MKNRKNIIFVVCLAVAVVLPWLFNSTYYLSLFDPSMNTNCLMGLATDEYCRILGEDGQPIEGLYGAGELIIGNLCGGTKDGARYPSCGTCLAAGIYGGPLAVRHALGLFE